MSGQSEQRFRNVLAQRKKDKIEEATQSVFFQALLPEQLTQQREARFGRVALILVRREALRRVLEKERQLYVKEMSQKGLAIYRQRI